MLFNKRIALFLLCINCFWLTSFNSDDEWVLKKYDKGVAVYNRGLDSTSIKELKAVTQIRTSLSSIIELLNDRKTYPKWVYKCGDSHLIKRINDAEGIYYQNVIAPWPIDNRDFVVDVKVTQDADTKVVTQKANCIPNYIPKTEGHVRITEFRAIWILTPLKNGLINCEYQLLVDPGGNIPAWLVNIAAIDGPYETTLNMREWVMKDKYQKATFTFIKEP